MSAWLDWLVSRGDCLNKITSVLTEPARLAYRVCCGATPTGATDPHGRLGRVWVGVGVVGSRDVWKDAGRDGPFRIGTA